MKNINKVFLLGNVSREPEIKTTSSGKKVAIFGIATNRDWTIGEDKEKQSTTEFHNCIAWGKLADLCESYLTKGKLVHAEGYLKTRSWEDENGSKHFRTEIVIMEIIILEKFSKKDADSENVLPTDDKEEVQGEKDDISTPLFDEE